MNPEITRITSLTQAYCLGSSLNRFSATFSAAGHDKASRPPPNRTKMARMQARPVAPLKMKSRVSIWNFGSRRLTKLLVHGVFLPVFFGSCVATFRWAFRSGVSKARLQSNRSDDIPITVNSRSPRHIRLQQGFTVVFHLLPIPLREWSPPMKLRYGAARFRVFFLRCVNHMNLTVGWHPSDQFGIGRHCPKTAVK